MKGLNKIALASAIAAAPFATQAMEPMSEKAMGDTTGQAGVTIELDTKLSIDQIAYSQGSGTGSFLMNNTDIRGVGEDGDGDANSLDIAINVDLVDDGYEQSGVVQDLADSGAIDADSDRGALNDGDALISIKNIQNDPAAGPVDMNVSVDNMGLAPDGESNLDDGATMISDLDMDMYLSQLDIVAQVEDLDGDTGDAGSLGVDTAFTIDSLDVDFDVASVELVGMRMAGVGSLSTLQEDNTLDGSAGVNPAVVSMDIGATGDVQGGGGNIDEALGIELANFQADMWMPEINVGNNTDGGSSIGSVGIDNLQVTDTSVRIYGRD